MRIRLLVFSLLLVVSLPLSAQQLVLGGKIGPNISTVSIGHVGAYRPDAHANFHAGGFAQLRLGRISASLEAFYTCRKVDWTLPGSAPMLMENKYLELPLMIHYDVLATDRWRARVGIGASLALGSKAVLISDDVDAFLAEAGVSKAEFDFGDAPVALRGNDSQLLLGAGAEYTAGKLQFSGELRYNTSLSDIFNDGQPALQGRFTGFTVLFGLGWRVLGQ